jgi:hypothetical protein
MQLGLTQPGIHEMALLYVAKMVPSIDQVSSQSVVEVGDDRNIGAREFEVGWASGNDGIKYATAS